MPLFATLLERRRLVFKVAALLSFLVFLILSVMSPLLERPQFASRQGPWAREVLGQPLPLRLYSTVGQWSISSSATDADEVTFVKMLAVGQRIEEFTSETPPECTSSEKASGCVVWASRRQQRHGNSTKKKAQGKESAEEAKLYAEALGGTVVTSFDANPSSDKDEPQASNMVLAVQDGTALGAETYALQTFSQWNDSETVTQTRGRFRWVSFGARKRYGVEQLRSIYPLESGKEERDASETSRDRRKRRAEKGFSPATTYFQGKINSTDAVRLFEDLCGKRAAEEEERRSKDASRDNSDTTNHALVGVSDVLGSRCFWLSEVVYQDINNPEGVVEGRAWSTCGDRMVWRSSAETFEELVHEANLVAFLVLFTTALPMTGAIVHQMAWMRNSRTRMLRVNPYQLMFTAFMLSLSVYLLSASANYTPSAVSAVVQNSKPTFILHAVVYFAEVVLFFVYFTVDHEFTNYFRTSENARSDASRRILIFFFLVWVGPGLVVGLGGVHNPWVSGVLAAVFWVPQYIHCFTMDGWTGLTAPFILANLSLLLTPMLAPLLAPAPWTLPRSHAIAVIAGSAVLLLEGGLLLALRLNDGKNLIPTWMAPWRHTYKTTPEAQRAALLESPLCPICRNQLSEGWDEHDELWRTPCNHLYHKSCLVRWMQERTECPLCRKLLPEP